MGNGSVVSLADRLKQRREELGISQAQAARELDVARTAYRLWEMEAARPAPDRWRLVARWLGVSVTALLLAEELVSDEEVALAEVATFDFGRPGRGRHAVSTGEERDFFGQARALIDAGSTRGEITAEQAQTLEFLVGRIEQECLEMESTAWEATELRKTLAADEFAPRAAREALSFVGAELPEESLQTALLLASELVTNCVRHGPANGRVGFNVDVGRERLRVEVSDGSQEEAQPTTPSEAGGYGLAIVAALASRWGAGRDGERNLTWFEVDLTRPGVSARPAAE